MPSAVVTSRSGPGSAAVGAGSSSAAGAAAGAQSPTNGSGSGLSPRPHNQRPRSHSAAKSSPQKNSDHGSAGGGSSSGKKPHKSNGATGAFASSSSAAAALGGSGASSQHHAHGNGHALPVFPVSSPDAFDAIVQASNPLHPDHAVWKERFGSLKPPSSRDGHGSGSASGSSVLAASGEPGSEAAANGSAGGSHAAHKHSERLLSPDAEQHSPSSSKLSSSGTRARRSSSNARTRGAALPASTSENSAARRSPSKSLSAASGSAHVHSERHRAQEVLSSLYPPGSPIASGLPATGSSSLNGGGSNFLHLHNNGSGSALGHAFSGGGSEMRRRSSDSSDDHTFAGGTSLGHGADARGGSTVSLLLRPSDGASSSAAAAGSGGAGGSASVPASAQSTPRRRRRREGSASTGGGSRGDSKGKAKALPPPVPPPRIASHPDNNPVGSVSMLPAPSQSSFMAQNGGASGSGSMAHSSSAFSQASTSASMLPGGGAGALGFPSLHDSNHGSNGGVSSAMVSIPSRSSFTASRSQSIDLPRVQARSSSMLSEADREAVLASVFGQPIPKQPQLPASHGPGPVPASPTSPTGRPRSSSFNSSFDSSFTGSQQADTSTSTIQGDRSNASSVAGVYSVPSNSKAKAGRPTQARHLSTVYQEDTAAEDEFFDANEDEANASLSFTNGSVSPSRQLKTSPLNAPGIPSIRANDGKLLDSERGGKSRSNTDMNSSKYSASFHSMGSSRGTAATTTTGAGAAMLRDMSDQEKREFLAHNSYYIPPASRQSPSGSPGLRGMSSSPHLASSKPHKKSARAMTSASERGSRETRSESTHHSGPPPPLPPPPPPPPEEDTSTSSARRPSMWKRLPSFGRRKRTPSDARFAASDDGHSRADSSRSDFAPPSVRRDSLVPPMPASAPVAAPPQMRSSPSLNSMSSRPDVSVASTTAPVSASQPPGGPMGPPPVRTPRAAGRPSLSFERPSFLTKDPKKATRDQHLTHLPEPVMSAFAAAQRDERRTPGLFGSLRNKLSSKSSRAHPPAPLPVGFAAPPAKSPVAGPALSPVPLSPSIAHESTASAEAASSSSPAPWPSSPRTRQAPALAPRTGPAGETHLQPPKPSEDVRAFDAMLKDFGQAEAQRRRDLVGRARQGLLAETDLPMA